MSSPTGGSEVVRRLDTLYEFERAPVSEDRLEPPSYFAGVFSGEHVAATEFVIGALLVSFGASATDVVLGLFLGNLLAVLSWTFVCAPIAVETRLTLYWYLRRIAGPGVTLLYNLCNAVMYCILAGAMITVSASAVRLPFGIPAQTKWYPEDMRFVVLVVVVGAVVVTLAVLGFKRLAQFAVVCSPWMVLMFVAGAIVMLPTLATVLPGGRIEGLSDLWTIANRTIWKGASEHASGGLGFWHVVAFAWICNLAMHVGLSDMAIFRFARRSSYGLLSAFGMFVGHYLAWICAGIMGAAAAFVAGKPLTQLDSGDVANQALGAAGAVAVVIAGWTTANPTLYRAGLALQVVTGWPRWLVTLVAGALTTLMACSPFVFTKLLDFVGVYGLLLMPVGAIVFVEHWIFPRIGLAQFWVSRRGLAVSWPALVAWLGSVALAVAAWQAGLVHLFFLAVPVWALTAVVYVALAAVAGARGPLPAEATAAALESAGAPVCAPPRGAGPRTTAWTAAGLVTLATLVALVALPMRVFAGDPGGWASRLAAFKVQAVAITVVYFVAGTYWMSENEKRRARGGC